MIKLAIGTCIAGFVACAVLAFGFAGGVAFEGGAVAFCLLGLVGAGMQALIE